MNTAFGFLFAALALLVQLPAAIRGVLTDASGALIPGAAVSLSGPDVQKTVQTAADGSFSFQGLAAGDYTLWHFNSCSQQLPSAGLLSTEVSGIVCKWRFPDLPEICLDYRGTTVTFNPAAQVLYSSV